MIMTEAIIYGVTYYSLEDDQRHQMICATMAANDGIEATLNGVQHWLESQDLQSIVVGIIEISESGVILQDLEAASS